MKKGLMTAAALGAILAAPSVASANEGWFVRGALGYGAPGDALVTGALNGEIQGEADLREALAFGYQWANGFRTDIELAHRYTDTGAVGNFEDSSSDFQNWSIMISGIYEFNRGSWWRPYIGGGLGWVSSDFSAAGWTPGANGDPTNSSRPVDGIGPTDPRYVIVNDDDNALGFQFIAGIGWELTRNLTLETEYRYFGFGETDYQGALGNGTGVDVQVEDLSGHEAWVGLRYLFAASPPPPPAPVTPPPPPPAPVTPPPPACDDVGFVVYFEWDRSNLTDQARSVIRQAAEQASGCGVSSISIAGHADRSGPQSYNVGLSERRARAVRDELVRLGLPASTISIEAFGESRPAVQTPDGVREPQNRRSEVVIDLR